MHYKKNSTIYFLIILLISLFLSSYSISGADNPAARIKIDVPGTIQINPRGEALVDVKLTMPLGYFIFLDAVGKSSNQAVEFSFPHNSELFIKKVNKPTGKKFKNDMVLSGNGVFQLTILDKKGLTPGSTVDVSLHINIQAASTKQVYASYTLQQPLVIKVSGQSPSTDKPKPNPITEKPPVPHPSIQKKTINWSDNYNAGRMASQRSGRYLFLYFTTVSNTCDACNWMEKTILNQPQVVSYINEGFIPVYMSNIIKGKPNPDLRGFKIKAFPSVMIINSAGKVVYNKSGRINVDTLLRETKAFAVMEKEKPEAPQPPPRDYKKNLAAALYDKNNTAIFFLNDGYFIEYDLVREQYKGKAQPINNKTWRGLEPYSTKIIGALNWGESNKAHIFLSTRQYLRVDLEKRIVDPGYPKPVNNQTWRGLDAFKDKITGAVKWKGEKIYFFLSSGEYIRYDMNTKRVEDGYPKPINDRTWPGLQKYARAIQGVTMKENGLFCFILKDGNIIQYDIEKTRIIAR